MTFKRQPVYYIAVIRTAIHLAVVFGMEITIEQKAALMMFTEAVFANMTHDRVSPVEPVEYRRVAPAERSVELPTVDLDRLNIPSRDSNAAAS